MLRISVIMGTIWKRKIILADKKRKTTNVAMANSDPDKHPQSFTTQPKLLRDIF